VIRAYKWFWYLWNLYALCLRHTQTITLIPRTSLTLFKENFDLTPFAESCNADKMTSNPEFDKFDASESNKLLPYLGMCRKGECAGSQRLLSHQLDLRQAESGQNDMVLTQLKSHIPSIIPGLSGLGTRCSKKTKRAEWSVTSGPGVWILRDRGSRI
jgi:hypothetical protein